MAGENSSYLCCIANFADENAFDFNKFDGYSLITSNNHNCLPAFARSAFHVFIDRKTSDQNESRVVVLTRPISTCSTVRWTRDVCWQG